MVWEGFSDVFRAVGLGVGAIWTLDFGWTEKKICFFLSEAGVSQGVGGERVLIDVLQSKETLSEGFAHI